MIYCIWYPSGGFGHFINGMLSLHGENFKRPIAKDIKFSSTGNSHALDLIAPKYYLDPEHYSFDFDPSYNYSVLVDNGINNEGQKFKSFFPTAQTIKICYDDISWPVVARTMIDKAMRSSISKEIVVDDSKWNSNSPWELREKYFLFLRDHPLRQQWKPSLEDANLLINDMFEYNQLVSKINNAGIPLTDCKSLWDQWFQNNEKYIKPVIDAQSIINNLKNNLNLDLSSITDVWNQAVLYYFLWITFEKEVPHNDYANFFKDTDTIQEWLTL